MFNAIVRPMRHWEYCYCGTSIVHLYHGISAEYSQYPFSESKLTCETVKAVRVSPASITYRAHNLDIDRSPVVHCLKNSLPYHVVHLTFSANNGLEE